MAQVYKAWDMRRQYYVAIKVMREDLAEDLEFLRRFRAEAANLARLAHENIVRFYSFERDGNLAFIVMAYVPGKTLRRRILEADGNPLPFDEVLSITQQVCKALHYAHQEGLIHRDVKPGNIMLQPDGKVLLSDFGIAKAADAATSTTVMPGAPAYMSPEQCRSATIDARSDIYSLGVVLYEMLTGHRPFVGDAAQPGGTTSERIRWEQVYARPPSLRQWNLQITPEIDAVVLRCLEKQPARRYATTLDLYNAFARAIAQARPLDIIVAPKSLSQALPTRRGVTAGLFGVAIVLIAVAVLVGIGNHNAIVVLLPTVTDTIAPTAGARGMPPETRTPTACPLGICIATPTNTPTITLRPPPTNTSAITPTPTNTPTRVPTFTRTPTATRTPRKVNTLTPTSTPTSTPMAAPFATNTPPAPTQLEVISIENIDRLEQAQTLASQTLTTFAIFSADGQILASGSEDTSINLRLWKASNGALIRTLPAASGQVGISRDNTTVAMPGVSATLWDIPSGNLVRTLPDSQSHCVAFSPDGIVLAVGYWAPQVQLWDVKSGNSIDAVPAASGVTSVAFSPNGQYVAAGSAGTHITLWDTVNQSVRDLPGGGFHVSFSSDGRLLVGDDRGDHTFVSDVATGQVLQTFIGNGFVTGAAFSPDRRLVVTTDAGSLIFWNIATGKIVRKINVPGGIYSVAGVAFSPDGLLLVTAGRAVRIWRVR
jgi:serine/threonine protein kinase